MSSLEFNNRIITTNRPHAFSAYQIDTKAFFKLLRSVTWSPVSSTVQLENSCHWEFDKRMSVRFTRSLLHWLPGKHEHDLNLVKEFSSSYGSIKYYHCCIYYTILLRDLYRLSLLQLTTSTGSRCCFPHFTVEEIEIYYMACSMVIVLWLVDDWGMVYFSKFSFCTGVLYWI